MNTNTTPSSTEIDPVVAHQLAAVKIILANFPSYLSPVLVALKPLPVLNLATAFACNSTMTLSFNPDTVSSTEVSALAKLLRLEVYKFLQAPADATLSSNDLAEAIRDYTAVAMIAQYKTPKGYYKGADDLENLLLEWAKSRVENNESLSAKLSIAVDDLQLFELETVSFGANLPSPAAVLTNLREFRPPTNPLHSFAIGLSLLQSFKENKSETHWLAIGLFIKSLVEAGQEDVAVFLAARWMRARPHNEEKGERTYAKPQHNVLFSLSPILRSANLIKS